jgi:hypothetical protein
MIINNKDKGGRIKTFRKKSLNSDSHQSTYINKQNQYIHVYTKWERHRILYAYNTYNPVTLLCLSQARTWFPKKLHTTFQAAWQYRGRGKQIKSVTYVWWRRTVVLILIIWFENCTTYVINHVMAAALTTGRMIPSGTNSLPAEDVCGHIWKKKEKKSLKKTIFESEKIFFTSLHFRQSEPILRFLFYICF